MWGTNFADWSFGTLDAYRARIGVLRKDCDAIAARRQRELDDANVVRATNTTVDLLTYLYADCRSTYPVLATVGSVAEKIERLNRTIERAMYDAS